MSILKPTNRYLQRFAFTKREFNALLVMLFVLLVLIILPYILRSRETAPVTPAEQLAIHKLELVSLQKNKQFKSFETRKINSRYPKPVLFPFDPNTASLSDWQKMGFSAKQAQIIINYVSKGGHFYKPEDLKKMFVVSDKKYEELKPYIAITAKPGVENRAKIFVKTEKPTVDVNSADSATLEQLRGIGPAFARRIIMYRQRLGGFYRVEQLKEVWGLDSALYVKIAPQLKIDPKQVKKIAINTATFETLKKHPYLSYRQMNAIINYRKQHGDYRSEGDLAKVVLLDAPTIAKILPYIEF